MDDPIDVVLKSIELKLRQLDIYWTPPGQSESRSVAAGTVEDYNDTFIEAIALKSLDPQYNTTRYFRTIAQWMPKTSECRTDAKVNPEEFDRIVGEAVGEFKHAHLKARPRVPSRDPDQQDIQR